MLLSILEARIQKKCKGLPLEYGLFFIEVMIVTAPGSRNWSPLNFIFAKEEQVIEFCETKSKISQ